VGLDGDLVDAAEPPGSAAHNEDGSKHDVVIEAADALRKFRRDGLPNAVPVCMSGKLANDKPLGALDR
jgi:hypothetical protein